MEKVERLPNLLQYRPPMEQVVRWVNGALVVAVGLSLAQLTWRVVPEPVLPKGAGTQYAFTRSAAAADGGLGRVAQLHLFGDVHSAPAAATAPVDAPDTHLNLTLRGVFASDQPKAGLAIVADGSHHEDFYRSGSQLPGGAKLSEVYPDRIILERNGRYETLRLPEESKSGVNVDAGQAVGAFGSPTETRLPELARYRQEIAANPAKAMDLIRLQPMMDGGQLNGYRIYPGRDRELFNRSGLQPGDVVTSVNGISLDDPGQLNEVFRQLNSASQLQLTVERGGATQNIIVGIN